MKIGIISDIHGNHYALDSVLKDCKKQGVDHLLVLGDIVGYYYRPEVVLSLLSTWSYDIIKGNHEIILQQLNEKLLDPELVIKKYGRGHEEALMILSPTTLKWLYSLPHQKSVTINNVSFQLNHGSPWNIEEYLYPDTSRDKMERCNSPDHDFVLIGHSHYAFSYRCENSTLINCGSVGQSRQRGGVAYWAMVNTSNKCFEIKTTPYSTSKLIKDIQLMEPEGSYSSKILIR